MFSESAALSVGEIAAWADEEAECVTWRLKVAERTADPEYALLMRSSDSAESWMVSWN